MHNYNTLVVFLHLKVLGMYMTQTNQNELLHVLPENPAAKTILGK